MNKKKMKRKKFLIIQPMFRSAMDTKHVLIRFAVYHEHATTASFLLFYETVMKGKSATMYHAQKAFFTEFTLIYILQYKDRGAFTFINAPMISSFI